MSTSSESVEWQVSLLVSIIIAHGISGSVSGSSGGTDDTWEVSATSSVVSGDTGARLANIGFLSTSTSSDHVTRNGVLSVSIIISQVESTIDNTADGSWVESSLTSKVSSDLRVGSAWRWGGWELESVTWHLVLNITIIVADSESEVISNGADSSRVECSSASEVGLDKVVGSGLSALGSVVRKSSDSGLGHIILEITIIIINIVGSVGVDLVDGTSEPSASSLVVDLNLLSLLVSAVSAGDSGGLDSGCWYVGLAISIIVADVVHASLVSTDSGWVVLTVVLVVDLDVGA